jgi:hypothetical protein
MQAIVPFSPTTADVLYGAMLNVTAWQAVLKKKNLEI